MSSTPLFELAGRAPWLARAREQVAGSLAAGRLPHALLLQGAPGLGKAALADWIARLALCDRYTDASYAYQGGGRGVDQALLDRLAAAVHADLWPARTLLLDLPVDTGLARAKTRPGAPDRFESEQRAFFERVRACYLARAAADPMRIRTIDASRTLDAIAEDIARTVRALGSQ